MLLIVPAWKWTRKEKLFRASMDPVSEVVPEWGGWNQQGLCRVGMEKARAGYMVTVRVCVDPAWGNTLCNFKIYLFILVLPGHSSESTPHPLTQTLISLCWRVGRPRDQCVGRFCI